MAYFFIMILTGLDPLNMMPTKTDAMSGAIVDTIVGRIIGILSGLFQRPESVLSFGNYNRLRHGRVCSRFKKNLL